MNSLIKIIFEDESLLVINKPAGLIVHSDGRTEELSVAEWVSEKYPEVKDVGESWTSPQGEVVPRPGIVHRLDRDTSGVMIIAKTNEMHAFLKKQFQERTTEKVYNAFVYGHPKTHFGTIEAEIGRARTNPPRWSAKFNAKGHKRNAITDWRVLKLGLAKNDKGEDELKVSLLEARPKTGRTHQIRVHFQAMHHPIICDKLYAPKMPCVLGFERQALHASSITIYLPSGDRKTFVAEMPEDFIVALSEITY